MKTRILTIVVVVGLLAVCVQAATVTDPLQNRDLWYSYAAATPLDRQLYGDPLGPDDGWLVEDNTSNCRWNYRTTGWNRISSVQISQLYHSTLSGHYFLGYDYATGVELANKTVSASSPSNNPNYFWRTVSYSPTGDHLGLHINGTRNNGGVMAGTVKYETTAMLGTLLSENTVDTMANYSKWYDADTLRNESQWYLNPGNIKAGDTSDNLTGDPLGPDDAKTAKGLWANDYWASYKTVSGKFFGQVSISFLLYRPDLYPTLDAYIQYWNGSSWVNATGTSSGLLDSSHEAYKWVLRSYNLTGLNVDQIRVFGDASQGWDVRIGTVDMQVIPEPATLAILGFGAALLLGRRK